MISIKCGTALGSLVFEAPGAHGWTTYNQTVECDCDIAYVGKLRNGRPKYWCKQHAEQLRSSEDSCPGQGRRESFRCLSLEVESFEGGIGIWGSLPPAIDTATRSFDPESLASGVHVHARPTSKAKKTIDATFDLVALYRDGHLIQSIDTGSATALVQSRIAGMPSRHLMCSHCGASHIDEGWFAVNNHKKHQCLCCGREFFARDGSMGSALEASLHAHFPSTLDERVPANRSIDVTKHVLAGRAVRMWGTHQALVWTAQRPEESGIHVHVYNSQGEYVVDETYDSVSANGREVDAVQIRLLMLQRSLSYIASRIEVVACDRCQNRIFEVGIAAITPSIEHVCEKCGGTTRTRRKVVSNPLSDLVLA